MTELNMAKGLFRIWIVLTVCWLSTSTFINYDDVLATRPITAAEFLSKESESTKSFDDFYKFAKEKHLMADWPRRLETAKIIFLPPLCLLILGLMFAWIIKGFKE